nr:hypothetical protein CFP56_65442 [Quercus suber]
MSWHEHFSVRETSSEISMEEKGCADGYKERDRNVDKGVMARGSLGKGRGYGEEGMKGETKLRGREKGNGVLQEYGEIHGDPKCTPH